MRSTARFNFQIKLWKIPRTLNSKDCINRIFRDKFLCKRETDI